MNASPPPARPDRTGPPWRLIAIAALAVYAVVFVLLNRDDVRISFVFFSTQISELLLILLCLGLGFVLGYLFDGWRRRGRA